MLNTVKEGDTNVVPWQMLELDEEGNPVGPVDLTGVTTAQVTLRLLKGRDLKSGFASAPIEIESPVEDGRVMMPRVGTPLVPGRHAVTISITQGGFKTTAPTSGAYILIVDPDLHD